MEAHEVQSFDAAGNLVRNREAAKEAILAAAQPQPEAAKTSCWELSNGAVKFMIELETTPLLFAEYTIGGTIQSGLCGAPWAIKPGLFISFTFGNFGFPNTVRLEAIRQGANNNCPSTLTIIGSSFQTDFFTGTYGFDGESTTFPHQFRRLKEGSCP